MSRPTDLQQRRIDRQLRLLSDLRRGHAGTPPIWFGHLRIRTQVRETDVLLGAISRTSGPAPVVDWQTAPIAELFFSCDEGEGYELEIEDRLIGGTLVEKNLVTFEAGELAAVQTPEAVFARSPEGPWEVVASPPAAVSPRPEPLRAPFRSPLDVELDPAQRAVVELPEDRSVLLLGEAGFGKTTVALHRLLAVKARAGRSFRAGVIVPTEGLRRLTQLMIERRGSSDVEVLSFDEWITGEARRVFRGLPSRNSENTPALVLRLKRHPALRPVLSDFVASDRRRPTGRRELEHLFGDRAWMEQVVARSEGALPPAAVGDAAEQTRIQFLATTEAAHAHVDADRLVTVDGRRIDEGTPTEDANSLDVEDCAVLFELERIRAERDGREPAKPRPFDLLLLDEAQELAPIELAALGRAVRPGGTLIVAGDAAQQVDPTGHFAGWDAVLQELGVPGAERTTLEKNYRCPPEVTALARSVIGRGKPAASSTPAITRVQHPSRFHLAVWMAAQIGRLQSEDPSGSLAVICRSPESARAWCHALRHACTPHLGLGGDFPFRPGVVVTCVAEVKGLEFDYVLLPDANPTSYPATEESRRALYVALTRASHRLVLATDGPWSTLL